MRLSLSTSFKTFVYAYLLVSVGLGVYMRVSCPYLDEDDGGMHQMLSSIPRAAVMCNVMYISSYIFVRSGLQLAVGPLSSAEQQAIFVRFVRSICIQALLVLIVARPRNVAEVFFWLHFTKGVSTCRLISVECGKAFQHIAQQQGVVYPSEHKGLFLFLVATLGYVMQLQNFYTLKLSKANLRVVWLISSWCVVCKYNIISHLTKFAIHSLSGDPPTPLRDSQTAAASLFFSALEIFSGIAEFAHVLWRFHWKLNSVSFFILMQMLHSAHGAKVKVNEIVSVIKKVTLLKKLFEVVKVEEEDADDCVICQCKMTEGFRLPCGHHFHIFCLSNWVETQWVCPVCRLSIDEKSVERMRTGAMSPFSHHRHSHNNNGRDPLFEFGVCNHCTHYECDTITKIRKIRSGYLQSSASVIRKVYKIRKVFPKIGIATVVKGIEEKKRMKRMLAVRAVEARTRKAKKQQLQDEESSLSSSSPSSSNGKCALQRQQQRLMEQEDAIELEDEKDEGIPTFRDDFWSSSAERSMSLTKRKNDLFNFAKMKMQKRNKEKKKGSNSSDNSNGNDTCTRVHMTTKVYTYT